MTDCLKILNQVSLVIGVLCIQDEAYLFREMEEGHLVVVDVLEFMVHVYLEMVEGVKDNISMNNTEIAKIMTQREKWIKHTIWVL